MAGRGHPVVARCSGGCFAGMHRQHAALCTGLPQRPSGRDHSNDWTRQRKIQSGATGRDRSSDAAGSRFVDPREEGTILCVQWSVTISLLSRCPTTNVLVTQEVTMSSSTLEINHGVSCRANGISEVSTAAKHCTLAINFSQQAPMISRYLQPLPLHCCNVYIEVDCWLTLRYRLGWRVQPHGLQVLQRRWRCWMSCTSIAKNDGHEDLCDVFITNYPKPHLTIIVPMTFASIGS